MSYRKIECNNYLEKGNQIVYQIQGMKTCSQSDCIRKYLLILDPNKYCRECCEKLRVELRSVENEKLDEAFKTEDQVIRFTLFSYAVIVCIGILITRFSSVGLPLLMVMWGVLGALFIWIVIKLFSGAVKARKHKERQKVKIEEKIIATYPYIDFELDAVQTR